MLNIEEITEGFKDYTKSDDQRLSEVFEYFLKKKCPFVTEDYPHIIISKESYKYIFAIIRFDTELIDAEILSSLIYRMADRDEAGLYGHQTSFVNVEKLFQPLFF